MKIVVISDSHRNTAAMEKIAKIENPDLILHLGDHEGDCDYVFYNIRTIRVRGNCDWNSHEEDERFLDLGPAKIWMTHGHLYGVKSGLSRFRQKAMEKGADIALYGHTHREFIQEEDGLTILNPGTPDTSYGVITLSSDKIESVELKMIM